MHEKSEDDSLDKYHTFAIVSFYCVSNIWVLTNEWKCSFGFCDSHSKRYQNNKTPEKTPEPVTSEVSLLVIALQSSHP